MTKIKEFLFGSTNIYETVVPFYYSLKIFGLASFQLNVEDGKIRMRWKDFFLMFGSILLFVWIVYLTFDDMNQYFVMGSSIIRKSWKYQYLFQMLTIIPIITFGCLKRKHIDRIWESFIPLMSSLSF